MGAGKNFSIRNKKCSISFSLLKQINYGSKFPSVTVMTWSVSLRTRLWLRPQCVVSYKYPGHMYHQIHMVIHTWRRVPESPRFSPWLLHSSRTSSVTASSEITAVREKVVLFTDWHHPGSDGVKPSGNPLDDTESDSNSLRTMRFWEFTSSRDDIRKTKITLCVSIHSRLLLCLPENFYICVCLGPVRFFLSVLLSFLQRFPMAKDKCQVPLRAQKCSSLCDPSPPE